MTVHYDVSGAERKRLASSICQMLLFCPMEYLGMPTAAYRVGEYFVTVDGIVTGPDDRDLVDGLEHLHGFTPTSVEYDDRKTNDCERVVISMPFDGFTDTAMENLRGIVAAKSRLIKKALGADSLEIEIADGKLHFPWFTLYGDEGEMDAYLRFVTALCEMAKKLKRVTAKEKVTDNDKFAMRLFLVRLGFVGTEHKKARKILLKNLSGNSAWKDGRPQETTDGYPF